MLASVVALLLAADQTEFKDSDELSALWTAISNGQTEQIFDTLVGKINAASQRSKDGRGPLFWAYEFKNAEALALFSHLGLDDTATDLGGKTPEQFFPGTPDDMETFIKEAGGHVEDVVSRFKDREEDFAALTYEDDEIDGAAVENGECVDSDCQDTIDYEDDDEDEEVLKDEI